MHEARLKQAEVLGSGGSLTLLALNLVCILVSAAGIQYSNDSIAAGACAGFGTGGRF